MAVQPGSGTSTVIERRGESSTEEERLLNAAPLVIRDKRRMDCEARMNEKESKGSTRVDCCQLLEGVLRRITALVVDEARKKRRSRSHENQI